jgi:hypothetical protein
MAKRIEIIGVALVVTDTITGTVEYDKPKAECYYDNRLLDQGKVQLLIKSNASPFQPLAIYNLADTQDSVGATFNVATFRFFARNSLGFNSASGGSEAVLYAQQDGLQFGTRTLDNSITWTDVISTYTYIRLEWDVNVTGVGGVLQSELIPVSRIATGKRVRFEYGTAVIDLTFGALSTGDLNNSGGAVVDDYGLKIIGISETEVVSGTPPTLPSTPTGITVTQL